VFAWFGAACLLGGGWYVTNADYLKPRTILKELHRWTLPSQLEETRGMAYLDGTVFITGYRSATLTAFDAATGTAHTLLSPPPGPVRERPSDIQVGSDGLLYVLNNGDGPRALLVLSPDGQVVREIALDARSNITTGLGIGPDARLYVADMVGGRVRTYRASGGQPEAAWGGQAGGFNNVSGITLAPDGSLYAEEFSAHRIQHLAADGHVLRTFDLDCEPQYAALVGDWLDVTCGAGLLSLNTRTWDKQRTRISDGNSPFAHPRGLVYGPDGTLFVVDDRTLFQFSVQH
jgi:sugar lactone lactonase YvrE